jgi:hypothetical protein
MEGFVKLRFAAVAVFGVAAFAAPSFAAAPVISGNYIYVSRTFCQPTIAVQYANDQNGQNFVNGLNMTAPEDTAHEAGQANFTPATATVTFNSVKDHGSNVLIQTSGGLMGSVISEKTEGGSAGYSDTATSVTLNGQTFNATFGAASKGIVTSFLLVGLDGAGCSEEWNFSQ